VSTFAPAVVPTTPSGDSFSLANSHSSENVAPKHVNNFGTNLISRWLFLLLSGEL
jgi:hypothetical protein